MIDNSEVRSALPWMHGKLRLGDEFNLYYILGNLRLNQFDYWYDFWETKSSDGSVRPIASPKGDLRIVQYRINQRILSKFPRHPNSYGFMGGNCLQSAKQHLGFRSVLMFDLRRAFSQVTHQMVFDAVFNKGEHREPFFSFYCARFLADFCTVGSIKRSAECFKVHSKQTYKISYGGILPQGAPTSPRLFDLCMRELDDDLAKFSDRHGLTYTRYADNLYFSSQEPEFPALVRNIILSKVRSNFPVHKVKQASHGDMCRMLGLNVTPYGVTNTREFKRKFKGALHHLEYSLDHNLDFRHAWSVVRGLGGFAVPKTLPEKLQNKFVELNKKAHLLDYGW